jgi:hypothetical protein
MEVDEMVAWLAAHHHENVVAVTPERIESTLHGKRRAYELVEQVDHRSGDGLLFGDVERTAYWKRVAS